MSAQDSPPPTTSRDSAERRQNRSTPAWFDATLGALMLIATVLLIAMAVRNLRIPSGPLSAGRVWDPIPADPVSIGDAHAKGAVDAGVALIVYSDFQCPYCGKFAREVLPEIERRYVSTGKLRLIFRHLPLESIHASAFGAAEAVECAGQQGQFWPMHDLLFADQAGLNRDRYVSYAKRLKLDDVAFTACLGGSVADKVSTDVKASESLGVSATPTVLIGKIDSNGAVRVMERSEGAGQVAALSSLIEKVLSSSDVAKR